MTTHAFHRMNRKHTPSPASISQDNNYKYNLNIVLHCIQEIKKKYMGLLGKLSVEVEIKKGGDVFHELFIKRPHHVPAMSPGLVHACDLDGTGEGTVGSIIRWNYTHDGKQRAAKQLIEAIDEEKKSVRLKLVEGGPLETFTSFTTVIHVEDNGGAAFVTWTLEYEKKYEDVEDPVQMLPFFIKLIKDVESHHLNNN